ncbi:MAG: beta-N-acetylhexosaminidase [Desulfobacula sp. RIFOXYB2_FULL_45_6]|nr:MAG: beta-N-acetylhexosaminidase [Desulfobacula sp. RIFOXYB2_FULL_45_6]
MDWEDTTRLETAGQRLMLGFDGVELNEDIKHIIRDIRAGGLILFKQNIETPDQVKLLCDSCQAYARSCGCPPLFIAMDQEGGTVARLREPFTLFKGNPFIETIDDAVDFAVITARELKSIGVNMNFAPVLDVAGANEHSIMKDRAFKGNADRVASLGIKIIHTLQKNGIMAVAKHFPGIGRTIKDSHFFLPELDIELSGLERSDLIPFMAAKNEGVAGIMLSHILYPKLDKEWPASLSPVIAKDLLRTRIGYEGLVMTDDLDMKAIEKDIETCVRQILISGIDMALICHKGPNIDKAYHEITRLLHEDESLFVLGKKSAERISRVKRIFLKNRALIDFGS